MLVGHVAAALLAKHAHPRVSLGTAVGAALLADVMLFALVLAGVEHVGFRDSTAPAPYLTGTDVALSHGLITTALAAAVLGFLHWWRRRDPYAAAILGAVVISHWVLDILSHRPYVPFGPGVPGGLGWGRSGWLAAVMAIEAVVWTAALVMYVRDSRSTSSAGRYVFWGGIAALTYVWYENVAGRPPRSAAEAPIEMLILLAMTIGWGFWMNRARRVTSAS